MIKNMTHAEESASYLSRRAGSFLREDRMLRTAGDTQLLDPQEHPQDAAKGILFGVLIGTLGWLVAMTPPSSVLS